MRSFLLLALAAGLAGCSTLEEPEAGTAPSPNTARTTTEATPTQPRWKGARAQAYRKAHRICSVFTIEEIAAQREVRPRARRAARAFARWHYPRRQFKAAFRGCLDGFRERPPRV